MKHRALHVLVLDDAPISRTPLHTLLTAQGHTVVEAGDGNAALAILKSSPEIDVILLELCLPGINGFTVIREFRALNASISIIVVSKCDGEDAKVEALDLGADDYLTKPFGAKELFARIRASLRRRKPVSQVLKAGALTVNLNDRAVWLADEKIHLSPTEFALLSLLMRNAGAALTYAQISRLIWEEDINQQFIRIYVRFLRRRLRESVKQPKYILTVPKVGYQFGQEVKDLSGDDGWTKSPLKLGNIELVTENESCQLFIDGSPHHVGLTELSILEILLQYEAVA
jgi:two-component system KDP operon response regulator KdpE